MRRTGAVKSLGDACTSKFKMELGDYAESFFFVKFIYKILCNLID